MFRIRRRLIKWSLLAVGLPLAARVLHTAADMIEERHGPTPAARNLRRAGAAAEGVQDTLRGKRRGGRGGGYAGGYGTSGPGGA